MEKNQTQNRGEISKMKHLNLQPAEVQPIEFEPYKGETVVVKTIIRGGKKIQETAYFEDQNLCLGRGTDHCKIGNSCFTSSKNNFEIGDNRLRSRLKGIIWKANQPFWLAKKRFKCFGQKF